MTLKKSRIPVETIVYMFEVENKTLQEIGDVAGISRERVRQIVEKAGCKPRRVANRERREIMKSVELEEKKLKAEVRKLERMQQTHSKNLKQYGELLELWESNYTITEIAVRLGKSEGYVGGTISRLRSRWGWFKYRRHL